MGPFKNLIVGLLGCHQFLMRINKIIKDNFGTSMVIQWPRLHTPDSGGLGSEGWDVGPITALSVHESYLEMLLDSRSLALTAETHLILSGVKV